MSEHIEREALIAELAECTIISDDLYGMGIMAGIGAAMKKVSGVPAADVAPVRHGRWVEYENESDMGYHYCSECKHQAFNYDEGDCNVEILSDYCPHCGARMDGGDKNDE